MHYKIIFLLSLLLPLNIFGQQQKISSYNKKSIKFYHQAEKAFSRNDNTKALQLLEKAIEKDSGFVEAWLLKGDILSDAAENIKAIEAFSKAAMSDSLFFPPVWAILGRLYYETGDYISSVNAYKTFLRLGNVSPEKQKTILKLMAISEQAAVMAQENKNFKIIALDSSVNTSADEYVNFVDAANNMLIFTRKVKYYDKTTNSQVVKESFFTYMMNDTSGGTKPQPMDIAWMKNGNVGSLSFSVDGREMYFAGCGWERGLGSCDIYYSKKIKNKWTEPLNLGKPVNSKGWESQPAISADGKRLYFASKRKGGKGGSDIWMSVKLENGKWSEPENLGDSINTRGNEMAPFLYADDKTMIFSSYGRPALGGKDLFVSRKNIEGKWTEAKNIGAPVNTNYNEINLVYALDGNTVWFSSDRNNKSYDIFKVPVYKTIKPDKVLFVNGKTVDDITGKSIGNTLVLLTDIYKKKLQDSLISNPENGKFLIVLNKPGKYAFNIFAKGYLPYSETFEVDSMSMRKWKYEKVFRLKKIKKGNSFILKNIYFDLDKSVLKPESFAELDRLVVFLKRNNNLKLEITGHTDNTGTEQHNLKLSQQRAYSVYRYLVNNGISPSLITYRGMGDKQPLVPNTNDTNKAKNRRVEFIVR